MLLRVRLTCSIPSAAGAPDKNKRLVDTTLPLTDLWPEAMSLNESLVILPHTRDSLLGG